LNNGYQAGITREHNKNEIWNGLEKVKCLGRKILEVERDVMELGVFLVLLRDAQASSLKEKERDAPVLLAEDGAEKAAKLQVVWSDRVTNGETGKTTNTKDTVAVAHSIKWNWRGHVAGMEQCRRAQATSMWNVRLGIRRTGRPKTRSRQ